MPTPSTAPRNTRRGSLEGLRAWRLRCRACLRRSRPHSATRGSRRWTRHGPRMRSPLPPWRPPRGRGADGPSA
eukprot:15430430-Alexandrium_andersonii.AAC.1